MSWQWVCHPLSAVANAVIWLVVFCQATGTWGAQKKCFHFFVWTQLYKLCSSPNTASDNLHMCLGSRSFTAWIQVPGCSEKENHFFNIARWCGRNYIIPQPSWMVCCIQHEYLSFMWYYCDDSAQWVYLKLTQYNEENKWQKRRWLDTRNVNFSNRTLFHWFLIFSFTYCKQKVWTQISCHWNKIISKLRTKLTWHRVSTSAGVTKYLRQPKETKRGKIQHTKLCR